MTQRMTLTTCEKPPTFPLPEDREGFVTERICLSLCMTRVKKILNIRVFGDDQGTMWKKSVKDLSLEILSG